MFDRNFGKGKSKSATGDNDIKENIELMTIGIVKYTNYNVDYVKSMQIVDFIKLYQLCINEQRKQSSAQTGKRD